MVKFTQLLKSFCFQSLSSWTQYCIGNPEPRACSLSSRESWPSRRCRKPAESGEKWPKIPHMQKSQRQRARSSWAHRPHVKITQSWAHRPQSLLEITPPGAIFWIYNSSGSLPPARTRQEFFCKGHCISIFFILWNFHILPEISRPKNSKISSFIVTNSTNITTL